jgi:hypothetical protein
VQGLLGVEEGAEQPVGLVEALQVALDEAAALLPGDREEVVEEGALAFEIAYGPGCGGIVVWGGHSSGLRRRYFFHPLAIAQYGVSNLLGGDAIATGPDLGGEAQEASIRCGRTVSGPGRGEA